jgi:hypothetical protein
MHALHGLGSKATTIMNTTTIIPGAILWHRVGCYVHPVRVGEPLGFAPHVYRVERLDNSVVKEEPAIAGDLYVTELDAVSAALALAQTHVKCLEQAKTDLLAKGRGTA